MSQNISVYYVNNEGSGFADNIDVSAGTSIGEFFRTQMVNKAPSNYVIRVGGVAVPASYELSDGDQISITPAKIQGAL